MIQSEGGVLGSRWRAAVTAAAIAIATWVLVGCGGLPFYGTGVTDSWLVEGGADTDSGAATDDQVTSAPAGDSGSGALVARALEREAGNGSADGGVLPEGAGVAADAQAVDAPGDTVEVSDAPIDCANDLSDIRGSDFHVDFDMLAMAGDGFPLVEQMAVCSSNYWVIHHQSASNISVELNDGTNTAALMSVGTVDDGAWHHVAVSRVTGTLSITLDGRLDNSVPNAGIVSFGPLALLQVGRSVCNTPFTGQIKNVCVTRE
jgi:Concanavalin A-like lectin/glucanases superfamily